MGKITSSIWFAIAAVVAVVGLSFASYYHGKNVSALEFDSKRKDILETAIKEARADWESQLKISQKGKENVATVIEKIVTVEKKIPYIVSSCNDLGADYSRLYNELIGAIKSGPSDSGPMVDGKVPTERLDGPSGSE